MKSKSYLFTYCYECDNHTLGFGSITMTQSEYTPINQAVIDDAIEWVRKEANMPADRKIAPLAFIRFEDDEETVAHCNLEENANYIAAILDADADGEVWTPPKEET